MEKSDSNNSSILGILVRLYWFAFGHALLLFFIISMFEHKVTVLKSIFYFLFLGLLILSRYMDVKYLDGTNAEGNKPATLEDFKSFFKVVIFIYSIIPIILFLI